MTDLEQRIFRIVTSTRVQADIPGAILEEIERTYCLVSYVDMDTLIDEAWNGQIASVHSLLLRLWPEDRDLEPIRPHAAASDAQETT